MRTCREIASKPPIGEIQDGSQRYGRKDDLHNGEYGRHKGSPATFDEVYVNYRLVLEPKSRYTTNRPDATMINAPSITQRSGTSSQIR